MSLKRADCVYDEMMFDADFWLPSDTSNKLRGKLTGSVSDGFRLSLEGAFFENYEVPLLWRAFLENNEDTKEDNSEIDIILGESRKGEKYTLVNNLRLKVSRKLSFQSHPQMCFSYWSESISIVTKKSSLKACLLVSVILKYGIL